MYLRIVRQVGHWLKLYVIGCINTIWPPEDKQDIARNMYM